MSYTVDNANEFSNGMFFYPITDIDSLVMSSIEAVNSNRASAEDTSVVDKWVYGIHMKNPDTNIEDVEDDENVIRLAYFTTDFFVGDKIGSLVGKRIAAILTVYVMCV